MRPQTPGMAASHEVRIPTLQMASHVPMAPAQPLSWQSRHGTGPRRWAALLVTKCRRACAFDAACRFGEAAMASRGHEMQQLQLRKARALGWMASPAGEAILCCPVISTFGPICPAAPPVVAKGMIPLVISVSTRPHGCQLCAPISTAIDPGKAH
jgi:hypothetical protein